MTERYHQYSFPVVTGNEEMKKAFNTNAYPTVHLIKNGSVVFRGRLELAEKVLIEALSRQ